MTLLETTRKFIEKERFFDLLDSVLVGVSGGEDSMCLLRVLHQAGYKISAAHVNYKLRGEESDKDEELVRAFCQRHELQCHVHRVTSIESDRLKNLNLQECARNIRYDFFQSLVNQKGYKKIAIAHHQNDVAETFLMNAIRGSGSDGLRSIQSLNINVVRPFLKISKQKISEYVNENNIPFRNDASNLSDKYLRNYIRNQVLPILESRWPSTIQGISKSAALLSDENQLLRQLIKQEKAKWTKLVGERKEIGPLSTLVLLQGHRTLLWNLLKDYRVSQSTIDDIIDNFSNTGNDYSTENHSIITDRDFIKIEKKGEDEFSPLTIDNTGNYYSAYGTMLVGPVSTNQSIETVDEDKILFPLQLRKWESGDRWQPLGMKGSHKKISDFLIDQKVDLLSKNKSLVLEDAEGNIIWLVGYRISELIKTTSATKSKIQLSWVPKL